MDNVLDTQLQFRTTVERWSDSNGYRAIIGRPVIARILIIKVDHVGDFILSFDALVALRQAFPEARFDLVCAPWNVELADSLGMFGHIHTVELFNKRADGEHPSFNVSMITGFRTERYDLAVDLRVDPDSRVILRHVTATFKVGFDSPDHRDIMTMFLPHYLPPQSDTNIGMHQTMLMLRLARSTADLFNRTDDVKSLLRDNVAEPIDIDLSIARDRFLVMCNTSSGRSVKNWPIDRFRRLIRWLAVELDIVVLLLGTPDQIAEAAQIIQFCGSANVISAVGVTSIRQAIGLLPAASLFIGNDSALTHVAARLGVPTVAIFSGIDPTVMWATLGERATILRAPVSCSPCHILYFRDCRGEHACLLNISESSVRAAVRKHLFAARRFGEARPSDDAPPDTRNQAAFREWISSTQEQIPQRYGDNHPRYIAQGGKLPIEHLLRGFTNDNKNNRGDINRFYMFLLIFDQIIKEQVTGDIAELGVYKGNTAVMLASLARQLGSTVYLLDTFEGFDSADLEGVDANKRMEFTDTSLAQVQDLVGLKNTRYVKGYFPGTATELPADARFCLVHIDCDLYAPFKAALAFFYDRLEPGGFMVMHDYASLHWDGAERAVDEFFADKAESVMPVPDGSGTVVVRKARRPDHRANWFVQRKTTGFANAWAVASNAGVLPCLASGWAQQEAWGVWGLGDAHVLELVLTHEPEGELELAVESMAALLPGRDQQTVTVIVAGETLATWTYDRDCNTAVRLVRIRRDQIGFDDGAAVVRVEFRPSSVLSPHDIDPVNTDDRLLGLGLIQFRQRLISPVRVTESESDAGSGSEGPGTIARVNNPGWATTSDLKQDC